VKFENHYPDLTVQEILREPYSGRSFPGFEDIDFFMASPSVTVGSIVTTSLPLRDKMDLTVMGILPETRTPLYRWRYTHLTEPSILGALLCEVKVPGPPQAH
jgi:hypothetical protein